MSELTTTKNRDSQLGTSLALRDQPPSILEFESPSAALIALPVPAFSRHTTWILGGLIFSLLIVFSFTPIDIVITANGEIVSKANTVVIQPLDLSIVKSINVHEGQLVHKGELLATLDATLTAASLTQYQGQVKGLVPELERLRDEQQHKIYKPQDISNADEALQLELFEQRRAQLAATDEGFAQQISSLEEQISGNLAQAQYYRLRLGLASDVETMRRQEEQLQVGSKLDTLAAADSRVQMEASMDQALASAQAEKASLQNVIAQRDSSDAQWYATIAQDIDTDEGTLGTAQANLTAAGVHAGLVEMRAPVDSIVFQVEKLSVGSVIQPADQFIQLTPLDGPLQINAYVSGSDSGWVEKGDKAEIKFDTFNYESYGDGRAHVLGISADSYLTPSASSGSSGPIQTSTITTDPTNATGQAMSTQPAVNVFYLASMSIDKLNLHGVPKDFKLVPGMPVQVDILVGYRTVMDYLLGRVLPVFHDAMREP